MSTAPNSNRKLRNPYERQPDPSSPLDFRLMPYESHSAYKTQHATGLYSLLDPSLLPNPRKDPISNSYSPRRLFHLLEELKTPKQADSARNSIDNAYSPRKLLNIQSHVVNTASPRLSQARQGNFNPYEVENTSNRLLYGHLDPYDRVRSPKKTAGLNLTLQESSNSPSSTKRSLMASLRFYDTHSGFENTPNGSLKPWKSSQSHNVEQFQSPYDRYNPDEYSRDRSSPYDRLVSERAAAERSDPYERTDFEKELLRDRSSPYGRNDRSNVYVNSANVLDSPNWTPDTNFQSVVDKEVGEPKGLALSYAADPKTSQGLNRLNEPQELMDSSSALQTSSVKKTAPSGKVKSLLDPVELDESLPNRVSVSNVNDHATLRQQGNPYKLPSAQREQREVVPERLSLRQSPNPYEKLPSAQKEPNSERLSSRQSYNPYDKLPIASREQPTERQSLRQSYNPYEKTAGTQNQYERQPMSSAPNNTFERRSLIDDSVNEIGLLTTLPLKNAYENSARSSLNPYQQQQRASVDSFGQYSQSSPNLYNGKPIELSKKQGNKSNAPSNNPYEYLLKPSHGIYDNQSADSEYEDLNLPSSSNGQHHPLGLNQNLYERQTKADSSPYQRHDKVALKQEEHADELLNLYRELEDDDKFGLKPYGDSKAVLNPYGSSRASLEPYGSSKTSMNPYEISTKAKQTGNPNPIAERQTKQTTLGKSSLLSPNSNDRRLPKPSSLSHLLLKLAYKISPGLTYKSPPGLAPRSPNPYEAAKKQSQFEQQKKEFYLKNNVPKVIINDDPIIPDFPVQETFKKSSKYNMKIVVVGDGGCGKTCLLVSYVQNKFPEIYVPTVFENYVTNVLAPNHDTIELALWDTAGQEEYERLRPLSYPNVDVLLVCFSLESVVSLQNVKDMWFPEVSYFCPGIPIVLVGTKSDLNSSIDPDLPIQLATEINAIGYVLCSAKQMFNIKTVFNFAIDHFLKQQRMNEQMERLKNRLSKHFGGHSRNQSSILHQRHASGHMKNSSFDSALLLDQPLGEDTYKSNPYGNFNNHKYQDNDLAFALDDRGKKRKGKKCTIL